METKQIVNNKPVLKSSDELIVSLNGPEINRLQAVVKTTDPEGQKRVGGDLQAYFDQSPEVDFATAVRLSKIKHTVGKYDDLTPAEAKKMTRFLRGYDEEGMSVYDNDAKAYIEQGPKISLEDGLKKIGVTGKRLYSSGWENFARKIPTWIFLLFTLAITVVTIRKNLSLIPLLGMLSCLYMMSEVELRNWIAFTIWLLIGLVIYFLYSRKNSKLAV